METSVTDAQAIIAAAQPSWTVGAVGAHADMLAGKTAWEIILAVAPDMTVREAAKLAKSFERPDFDAREREIADLAAEAVAARNALKSLHRTEWNSRRALGRRRDAMAATTAYAKAAGYTVADACHVVQALAEPAYLLPGEVAARDNAVDSARACR